MAKISEEVDIMSKANKWKLGLSSCCMSADTGIEDIIKAYSKNRVRFIEISYGQLGNFLNIDWDGLKKALTKYKRVKAWSFHLPFGPFSKINLATRDKELLDYTLAVYKEGIDRIAELGIKIAVIHPSGEPNALEDREELIDIAADALAELAQYAEGKGVTIAVEDIPRTCLGNCSDDIKKLIAKHPALRICFDTNHLLDQRNVDFVREVGDKIVTLHVSDYDFLNERHWLPYEGKIDWVELVTALEEVGYDGVWMYEIGFKAAKNIDRDRDLTFKDFKRNRRALVHKRPFKPIGTPNHEGCMAWTYYTEPKVN